MPRPIRALLTHGRPLLAALLPLLLPPLLPTAALGQDRGVDWGVETELGGSMFFGNRPQTLFTARTEVEGVETSFELGVRLEFNYGLSENDDGDLKMNRRSWSARSTFDFRPEEVVRPFISGSTESSFERRIDARYDAGLGVKLDRQTDRNNRIEFSLALLAEKTYPRGGAASGADDVRLARWSSNLRVRKTFADDRLSIDLRNDYRPVFDAFGNYTFTSQSAFTLGLTEIVALRLNAKIQHDSRAVARGASTNRDGQVQLSVVAKF